MRVLITGAAGFIGSHLADRLIMDGHEVVGLDNLTTGRVENFPRVGGTFAMADITNRHVFYEYANHFRPQLIVHCAASYSDPDLWHRDTDTNIAGTINAVLAAKHHGARLFYFNTALPPVSSYAISKIAGRQYIELSGVDHVTFRLSNIYGPRNLSGPIPTFYKRLAAGEPCTVTDTRRDMVYIDDLLEAVLTAIAARAFGTIDICSGRHLPIRDLYDAVAAKLGEGAEPAEVPAPDDDVKQMELNPTRAFSYLNWTPRVPLHEGVAAAVAWYRAYGVDKTYTHLALKG